MKRSVIWGIVAGAVASAAYGEAPPTRPVPSRAAERCSAGAGEACYQLALDLDPLQRTDEMVARLALACRAGHIPACLANPRVSRDPQFADRLRAACTERGLGCAAAAAFLTDATRGDERRGLLERGCDRGEGAACVALARLAPDLATQDRLLDHACRLEAGSGCVRLARLHLDLARRSDGHPEGGGIPSSANSLDPVGVEARPPSAIGKLYRQGAAFLQLDCMAFDAEACFELAKLRVPSTERRRWPYHDDELYGAGVAQDAQKSRTLRDRACALGETRACGPRWLDGDVEAPHPTPAPPANDRSGLIAKVREICRWGPTHRTGDDVARELDKAIAAHKDAT